MAEIVTDNYYALYIYLDAFWRRRYLIVACILLTPFFVLLSTYFLPKSYQASISIAVNNVAPPSMKEFSSVVDLTEQFAGLQAYISSPGVLRKVVLETGFVPPNASEKFIQQTTEELNKKLVIKQMEKNVFSITLVQNSPNYLTSILNALGEILIQKLESQNASATLSSSQALENELNKQKIILKSAQDNLNRFEEQHADLLPAYGDIYIARLREITRERGDAQAQYNALVAEAKELNDLLLKMNPVLGQIEDAIRDNDTKLASMRLIYTDNFVGVKEMIQRGNELRAERDRLYKQYETVDESNLQQLWNMVAATASGNNKAPNQALMLQLEKLREMQLNIKGLAQKLTEFKNQQDELNKKLRMVGDTSQNLVALKLAVKNNQSIYDDIQSRYNVTKLTATVNKNVKSANFQIVAYPQKPISSLQRPLSFFLVLGILSGILLGFGLATLLEFMDNTVRYRRDVESLTNLQVICRVEKLKLV
jgi:uncharacterized protein involved in exopolysaccharide biosynthesis